MATKPLALSLALAAACLFGGLASAPAADLEVTPHAHARLPHVTRGPAIPQYVLVQRYVVQQGLPDEGPLTLFDSPYSSALYPVEYAGPGYAYAPVYGPFYGVGAPRGFHYGHGYRGAFWHGGYRHGGWRGAWRGAAHRHPGMRTAARRMAPHLVGHGGHHR